MLERFKKHCGNPITWGAYYKLCGVALVASFALGIGMAMKINHDINQPCESKLYEDLEDEES